MSRRELIATIIVAAIAFPLIFIFTGAGIHHIICSYDNGNINIADSWIDIIHLHQLLIGYISFSK